MDIKKLITPEFRAAIGQYELMNGIDVECYSSKRHHADWCKVLLGDKLYQEVEAEDMDRGILELGYEEDFSTLLTGFVKKQGGDSWKEILIKDEMIKLERTGIKATFTDCTPQDVLQYILCQAGVDKYKLSSQEYGIRSTLIVDAQSAVDAIKDINTAWELNHNFFFQDNVFYWGTKPEQKEVYILEEDQTILSLNQYQDMWEAEIIAVPWLHHSQMVEVVHHKFSGAVEIEKTMIQCVEGKVKMYVYFRGDDVDGGYA